MLQRKMQKTAKKMKKFCPYLKRPKSTFFKKMRFSLKNEFFKKKAVTHFGLPLFDSFRP